MSFVFFNVFYKVYKGTLLIIDFWLNQVIVHSKCVMSLYIDAVNISNILKRLSLVFHQIWSWSLLLYFLRSNIDHCFQTFLITKNLSNALTSSIWKSNLPKCSCSSSPFNYGSAGHVISSDFNKVIDGLKSHILNGQKFRNTDMASLFYKGC